MNTAYRAPSVEWDGPAGMPEWLSINELADWLKIPRGTIYQRNARGTAPARHKIGRSVRYHRDDVRAWLDAQRPSASRSPETPSTTTPT